MNPIKSKSFEVLKRYVTGLREISMSTWILVLATVLVVIGFSGYELKQANSYSSSSTALVNQLSKRHLVQTPLMNQEKLTRLAKSHPTFIVFMKKDCPYCQWVKSNNDKVYQPKYTFYRENKHPNWQAGGKLFEFISKQNGYGFQGVTDGGKKLDWQIIKPNWIIIDVESKLGKQLVKNYNDQSIEYKHVSSVPTLTMLDPNGDVSFSVPMTEKINKNKPATQNNIRYSKQFIGAFTDEGDYQNPTFNEVGFRCGYNNGTSENFYQFLHAQELDPDNKWIKDVKNFKGVD